MFSICLFWVDDYLPIDGIISGENVHYRSAVFKKDDKWHRQNSITNLNTFDLNVEWEAANLNYMGRNALPAKQCRISLDEELLGKPEQLDCVIKTRPIHTKKFPVRCWYDDSRLTKTMAVLEKKQNMKQIDNRGIPIIDITESCDISDDLRTSNIKLEISAGATLVFEKLRNSIVQSTDTYISKIETTSLIELPDLKDFDKNTLANWLRGDTTKGANTMYVVLKNNSTNNGTISIKTSSLDFEYKPISFFSVSSNKNYGGMGFISDVFVTR